MENALGASGYTATMMALVFIVLGLGIAALFAALYLPARWKLKYRMEFLFVGLLVLMVWYADRESTAMYKQYQGEIAKAGQYPYVNGMTVETAVAIAGGYTYRADQDVARITRQRGDKVVEMNVEPTAVVKPGDTILVMERYF